MKMRFIPALAVLATCLSSGTALAQTPQPLTEEAINGADFASWQARQNAAAQTAAASGDPTLPPVREKEPGEASAATPTTPEEAIAAAEGVDPTGPAEVEVTGSPDKVVETPANSTDLPDVAGQQEAQESEEAETPDPFLVRVQVLLGRAHASPGVIDGYLGGNTEKAVRAFQTMRGMEATGRLDEAVWTALASDPGSAVQRYTIREEDVAQRYVENLPADYAEQARLEWLGFSGPAEMLAERFHMDESLLEAMNPDADFETPGTEILVMQTGPAPTEKVSRIVVDKSLGELVAYDESDRIVLISPATIGSPDSPSPSGTVTVKGVAWEPTYSYDPDKNFQQGENTKKMTLPAGPNGPVGIVWIDLSKPTYGIHGTPHPDLIDKAESHGCVRLTNWDAEALAALVRPNRTQVEFRG